MNQNSGEGTSENYIFQEKKNPFLSFQDFYSFFYIWPSKFSKKPLYILKTIFIFLYVILPILFF